MNQLKFGKNILIISLMTLLTVFSWIGFEVYRTYTKTTVPKIIKDLIKPLNPTLNQNLFEEIDKKYYLSTEELNLVSTPSPILEEESTSQTATQEGSLE